MNSRFIYIGIIITMLVLNPGNQAIAGINDIKPAEACGFLESMGFATHSWKNDADHTCGCSSPSVQIGSGNPFKSDLAYYVEGTEDAVSQLKLVLNVKNPDDAGKAHDLLNKVTQELFLKALNKKMPGHMSDAILKGENYSLITDDVSVSIKRSNWTMTLESGIIKGYDIKVIIK